jgi:gas vesicle protein
MENNIALKVNYLFIGLGAGVLIGILFAPKSGEEVRAYLAKKADEGKEFSQRKVGELRERAEDFIERSKQVAARQQESISAAVNAGRSAYQWEKSKAG